MSQPTGPETRSATVRERIYLLESTSVSTLTSSATDHPHEEGSNTSKQNSNSKDQKKKNTQQQKSQQQAQKAAAPAPRSSPPTPEQLANVHTPHAMRIVEGLLQDHYCVLDDFIGDADEATGLREEVVKLYRDGRMGDGEIGKGQLADSGAVRFDMRDDKIVWLEGNEPFVERLLKRHILRLDILSQKVNMLLRAVAPEHSWSGVGRSKIMCTCYPAGGHRYVEHYDNPNKNGRKVTFILYLNPDWRVPHGGILRLRTKDSTTEVSVAPLFNRLLVFWSDRRCPHEVLPTAQACDRFAITIWYLDEAERAQSALLRQQQQQQHQQ